jgi:hypothetical protein
MGGGGVAADGVAGFDVGAAICPGDFDVGAAFCPGDGRRCGGGCFSVGAAICPCMGIASNAD